MLLPLFPIQLEVHLGVEGVGVLDTHLNVGPHFNLKIILGYVAQNAGIQLTIQSPGNRHGPKKLCKHKALHAERL